MLRSIDNILNRVTMYRLAFYELLFLLFVAGVFGFFGILPYDPVFLSYSVGIIFCVSWAVNKVFAFMFDTPSNPESTWVTACILALIITPPSTWLDMQFLPLAIFAAAWASASKYIFAIGKKHIFNPAAVGVAIVSVVLGLSASWWVGTLVMAPFVLLGGLLLVHKIRRLDLFFAFMGTFLAGIAFISFDRGLDLLHTLDQSLLYAPALFFATVMLTEPATTPPKRLLRIIYGALVGLLFLPNMHVGSFYLTPEIALLLGNLFSFAVSPKYKLLLTFKGALRLSPDVYELAFATDTPISFEPGQYMEWTRAHGHPDARSVRRYFTLASSPTENEVKVGIKFHKPASTFKRSLLSMGIGETMVAGQLSGDFTLPKNKKEKLAFIAGGIGVTPFRSMVHYLLDTKEQRSIVLLYANKTPEDAVYKEVFDRAGRELGMKTVYAFTDAGVALPPSAVASIDARTVMKEVPDYKERTFYISGPQGMVADLRDMLLEMGVRRSRIKTDYFPGFA